MPRVTVTRIAVSVVAVLLIAAAFYVGRMTSPSKAPVSLAGDDGTQIWECRSVAVDTFDQRTRQFTDPNYSSGPMSWRGKQTYTRCERTLGSFTLKLRPGATEPEVSGSSKAYHAWQNANETLK